MMRRFLEFAIDKPLLNHIFLGFIFLVSVMAYVNIPKEIFPPLAMDKIIITGGYAGTSADVLDKMVVQTIEDDLQNISELDTIEATIKNGSFMIEASIKPKSNNISVLNDVKDIVGKVKKDIPADMQEPVAKINTHVFPLVLIAVAGDVSTRELLAKAEELKTQLSRFKELNEITIRGDSDEELILRIDEQKVLAYGLEQSALIGALKNISSVFPVGTIKQQGQHLYISTFNGEKTKQEVADTIISVAGVKVRIGDVADVSFELGDKMELSHYNGQRNISVNVSKSKEGDAIALVKEIRALLKQNEEKYPHLKYEIYTDTSVWIKNRLNTVFVNMMFGLMLVFISMMIFINRGIAFVVVIGIPVSFMIGLIVSEYLGHSLNMLSLLGALIALGMLVDEAIVVAENIYRHMEEGMERREAAIQGALEMFPAVLAATLTTIFAFLPMLLLTGEMGTFIKIIPIMITVLLLSSLFEAFYFLPLHAQDFLRVSKKETHVQRIWKKFFGLYDRFLHFLFRYTKTSLITLVGGIIVLTYIMIHYSKFQLFPDFDTTQIYVQGKVNINNELEDTEIYVTEIEQMLLRELPKNEMASVTSVIGMRMDARNKAEIGENLFHIFIDLKERAPSNVFDRFITPYLALEYDAKAMERGRDAHTIKIDIEKNLKKLQHVIKDAVFEELLVRVPGAGVVANDVEIGLSGKNEEELVHAMKMLSKALGNIDGVSNIANNAEVGERELKLRINPYGQQLGLSEESVSNALRAYYLKGEYAKMFSQNGLVRIKIESGTNEDIRAIQRAQIQIPASNSYVALEDICEFVYVQGYVALYKEDGKRIRNVFASLDKKKITSTEAMELLAPTLEKLREDGFVLSIKGEEKENNKNKKELVEIAIIAIFLIFITLVWLFNTIKEPLIIISTIPLSLFGVYLGHILMGLNLTMPGLIGIVGLAGVVVNDGLIMVSFIKQATNLEELMQKAKTRLRPIFLTSLTTILGLSTLIFFSSGQAKILQPMAVSLGFGIAWATVLNLIYIPLLYAIAYKVKKTQPQNR